MMSKIWMCVGLLALGACSDSISSSKVDADSISQIYTATYDADAQSIAVIAQFRTAGAAVELSGSSSVTHNLFTLTKSTTGGTSYRYFASGTTFSTTLVSQIWTWVDDTGTSRQNSTEIHTIGLPSSPPGTLSKSSTASLSWTGDALATHETVIFYLLNTTDSEETAVVTTTLAGGSSVTITSSDLSALTAGAYEMFFERQYAPDLAASTTEGGSISGIYRSEHSSLTLTN